MLTKEGKRRKEIAQMHPAIAYDYYWGKLNQGSIANKYNICRDSVSSIVCRYKPDEVRTIFNRQETALIFDSNELKNAMYWLKELGINYRMLSNNHEIIENYESRINN